MLFSVVNLCFVLGVLVRVSSGDDHEEGKTDLGQFISFPDLSMCSSGALLQAVMADLMRRMSEMENTVRPQAALITELEDRVRSLEEQLVQERTTRARLEGRVNTTQAGLTLVQDTSARQGEMAEKLKSDLCRATPKLGRLFHQKSSAGHYKYDLEEAKHACAEKNATLASYHQLYEAWQDGLDVCACAWLSDGTARYPSQTKRSGCGNKVDIINCGDHTPNDAWCFREMANCG
ncbi:Hyaluronan and proteoglycan link protein 3 [Branchiostoma belcheri]|nr:Hyaluronan and proteoglycan link protein 3 [Branchiostoma belcheri]